MFIADEIKEGIGIHHVHFLQIIVALVLKPAPCSLFIRSSPSMPE
jgi:hypothetical protein